VLRVLEIVPFAAPADAVYGEIRVRLEQAGTMLGGNDLLIAAHALALGDTIVTDNQGEFGRVEGLKVENWLRG
jgi:tRNA(fMet)-specific endonuclease VapC